MTRSRAAAVAAALCFCVASGRSAGQAPTDALKTMIDAERAFAAAAAARGVRAAFLEFLDDEAIGFQPTLGRAKDQWLARPEPPDPLATTLAWDPRTGGIARDGRFGWLTGPFTLVPNRDASTTVHGCYFSVWRRTAAAPWRVYLDLGIATPGPCSFGPAFEAYPGVAPDGSATRESLLEADRALDARSADYAAAFGAVADEHVRLHRDGRQPVVGREPARAALAAIEGPWRFTQVEGMTASSGDLGVTYGHAARGGDAAGASYYVRVWRLGPSGEWRLVFDTIAR